MLAMPGGVETMTGWAPFSPTVGVRPAGRRRVPGTGCRPAPAVYRRRRLLAAALLLGALLAGRGALSVLGGAPLTASEAGSTPATHLVARSASLRTYVVQPGDSLWSIARRAWPRGDVRPLVDALAQARHGRPIEAGERIQLPEPPISARGGGSGGR